MLKKFFISMLGSMAAIWLSLIILFFGTIIAIGVIAAKSVSGGNPEKTVLYLDLQGTIAECESGLSFTDIMSLVDMPSENLATIITAIDKAATDKGIKGIYINCAGSDLGIASRGELLDAIERFKKSGKWVYAYADNYTQGDYYIASAADELYLNPVGSLTVSGLTAQTMFYKDVLDKIGVDVDVVRVGSFKSAVEPFMRMDMSEASRMQTELYLGQLWGVMSSRIAENRGLAGAEVLNQWADSLIFTWDPERVLEQKAVSKLCYRSEVEKKIRELTNTASDKDLPLVTPSEYIGLKASDFATESSKHVAVLYAVGEISEDGETGIVSSSMVPEIEKLAKDKKVLGLVLRVVSPGGSAFASEQIWKALEDFKATGKPLYVSMGDYAASGGYYISCNADSIFCDPTTITGSIGIFGIIPNAERLIKNKIGLGISTVKTNKNGNFPSLFEAPTAQQLDAMQSYIERGYETFTSRVSKGRDIPVDSVKAIGGGRVWDGMSALKIGLVDKLGNLNDAVNALTTKLNLKATDYVCYPKVELSPIQTLLKETTKNVEINIQGLSPEETQEVMDCINKIRNIDPVQARMDNVVIR